MVIIDIGEDNIRIWLFLMYCRQHQNMVVLDTVILSGQHQNMDVLGTVVLFVESRAVEVVVEEVVVDKVLAE